MTKKLEKAVVPGVPSPTAPKAPKMPSAAPVSKKSVVKQVEQVNTPQMKDLQMKQAKSMEATTKNPLAVMKDESGIKPYTPPPAEGQHYHIMQNGQRITSDPVSHSHIEGKMGGIKHLESSGYVVAPVKKERLTKAPNGQWSIEEY
jgi:hypothetical protein